MCSLASRGESRVRITVETRPVGDPQVNIVQAGVARHEGFRTVLEADFRGVLERIVNELRAVGRA